MSIYFHSFSVMLLIAVASIAIALCNQRLRTSRRPVDADDLLLLISNLIMLINQAQ
jgi:hypothetical protein